MRTHYQKASKLVLSIIIIGFLIASTFLLLNAPRLRTADIASIAILDGQRTTFIPSSALSCTPRQPSSILAVCNTLLAGERLEVAVTFEGQDQTSLSDCRATYANAAIECSASFQNTTVAPVVFIEQPLGLTREQLADIQQQYRIANLTEPQWITASSLAAFIFTLGLSFVLWQRLQARPRFRAVHILYRGAAILVLMQVLLFGQLIILGFID